MKNKKQIVLCAQTGDAQAFQKLVRDHYVVALDQACRYLNDFHLAEDAIQDAFVYAYLNVSQLQSPEAFSGWLRRIVAGCCNRLRRRKQLPLVALDDALDLVSSMPEPDAVFEARDIRHQIQDAIRNLPAHERPVVTLFYIGGFSQKEIAALLDVPLSTANSRLHTSRQRLKRELMMAKSVVYQKSNKKQKLEVPALLIPVFPLPKGFVDSETYLRHVAQNGLHERYTNVNEVLQHRLDCEIALIVQRGWTDYFLIFQDLVGYAFRNDICIGPGRGSVSGSLLAYVLGITDVDPLKFGLIFERFLNAELSTVPDIDLDVDPERREELFDYLGERHAGSCVSRVISFGGDQSLGAIHKTASVILLAKDQMHRLPMVETQNGVMLVQIDERTCADVGLMKIDLLGLKTLTSLGKAVGRIREQHANFELSQIPLDDPKTLDMFAQGDTADLFLFKSDKMRGYLKNLQPNSFEDLIHLYAVYTQTPERVSDFINRKNGMLQDEISKFVWDDVLKETGGLFVYQEQLMTIAHLTAGYTYTQADCLRRTLNKDDTSMRDDFLKGCAKNNIERMAAEKCYNMLKDNTKWLFNKSHAVAYVLIAYRLVYLRTHYSEYF